MTRLFIIRHGQTHWNVQGRLQGSSDVELNDQGLEQARRTALSLVGAVQPDAVVVASPLVRARMTGQAVADALGVTLVVDERITERDYGVWEGLTTEEAHLYDPEQAEIWQHGDEPHVEGYESHELVAARMRAALDEWRARVPGDIIFATHGTSGRMLMLNLLGLPTQHHAVGSLENAAWSRLSPGADTPWTLERHNIGAAN